MTARFHCPVAISVGVEMPLPEEAAHHAARVLRLAEGDAVVLFDGEGGEYAARLVRVGREVWVRVESHAAADRESPLTVSLVQGLAVADKMDWIVQKATELGVAAVHPVAASRSVMKLTGDRADKRVAHWQGVAVAACEQSGRNRVPVVSPVRSLAQWLADWRAGAGKAGQCWVLDPQGAIPLARMAPPAGPVALLIGPEGGWTEQELVAIRGAGAQAVTLGPRILRTETAGLAALAAMQGLWGDFGAGSGATGGPGCEPGA
ncbi:16S rRNA (uracil(1498)-N(3))-methyltransferase [Uliginosibacterium sp. H1]|uniref:16S rRNA (uracil(1498)-N(3))-methyltransferase n=1 Tax=Uliginosibacterium sp. H1 TaxID=3114757 RepID=UPI002E18236B|nr:16S rRNA (uracil(1498)-N(3))-methyltransferase [Uliginosibacterium sp. H1]